MPLQEKCSITRFSSLRMWIYFSKASGNGIVRWKISLPTARRGHRFRSLDVICPFDTIKCTCLLSRNASVPSCIRRLYLVFFLS
ncbi:hypothetical protein GDO78_008055 [Eleutherodactylus coqui]|uniref:Uncharacterized protein n=1 Tax=Eleutherodactylus coqui TaxID=57060 RepID=A0A8J6FAE6_ELECQ|nr:hypothetical protein GDO78_008055 [Eleutherodactylus coqui]